MFVFVLKLIVYFIVLCYYLYHLANKDLQSIYILVSTPNRYTSVQLFAWLVGVVIAVLDYATSRSRV